MVKAYLIYIIKIAKDKWFKYNSRRFINLMYINKS